MNIILEQMRNKKELFWINNSFESVETGFKNLDVDFNDILNAEARLQRFKPLIAKAFPETSKNNGIIESELINIQRTIELIQNIEKKYYPGKYFLKADSHLPVSGSVKARGGIYEVLFHAEDLAMKNNLLSYDDDYSLLLNDTFKNFFSRY
ncbi:MAG: D-serine ammonia-lyase, partial [Clostridiales bacterium]|nr:D-serine ammonia-lyase [Clostridiales bacterium]